MYGEASTLASIGIPDARQCLMAAAPFLSVAALWWLVNRIDLVIAYLFPHREWERQLGWLNIRAQRRANAVLRWLGYSFHAILAAALLGIVWSVQAIPAPDQWSDAAAIKAVMVRLPVFLVSAGLWLVYLGCALLPKIRHQHEDEDLEKYRAEQAAIEQNAEKAKTTRRRSSVPPSEFKQPRRSYRTGDGPFGGG